MNPLSLVMTSLIVFVMVNVALFSRHYMAGDRNLSKFRTHMVVIFISLIALAMADNLLVFWLAWSVSNCMLIKLMIHKAEWSAARAAGGLAFKNFGLGAIFLGLGFGVLYYTSGTASIGDLLNSPLDSAATFALFLLLVAAMTQSAIWPFHRWLLSSLNSPTPVSALMHAGLVNGGGFLLVRFAPLYLQSELLMHLIFAVGIFSALLGTFYKLIQSDLKRMLACSTMGQMGFMVAQCGMGLFPAAIAHLCWHGLFKAYLFLASGNAAKEKHLESHERPGFIQFAIASVCGLVGSYTFAYMSGKDWLAFDTTFVLNLVAFCTMTQLALAILNKIRITSILVAFMLTVCAGMVYGLSISLVINMLPIALSQPLALDAVYLAGAGALFVSWLLFLFGDPNFKLWPGIYVKLLNGSQPHKYAVTPIRKSYHY